MSHIERQDSDGAYFVPPFVRRCRSIKLTSRWFPLCGEKATRAAQKASREMISGVRGISGGKKAWCSAEAGSLSFPKRQ